MRPEDEQKLLPPLAEVINAVNSFTRHYFQLSFIAKQFPLRLHHDPHGCDVFLLLGILSISARFTPQLASHYGSGIKAAETFMDRAGNLAFSKLYSQPTLEICQAFYLLSIAQQWNGLKNHSCISMGIAMRMAELMQLHREETYCLREPTPDDIIRAESARRTLWMLHSQDNLHSRPRSPVFLAASDITALLPSSERDFENGSDPVSRAALPDTPPAEREPQLVNDHNRSLFASLIQVHYYWGTIVRHSRSPSSSVGGEGAGGGEGPWSPSSVFIPKDDLLPPWDNASRYAELAKKLHLWENSLPNDHKWSVVLLHGYKSQDQDLAYLGVTMMTRLCNIVIRYEYLDDMLRVSHPGNVSSSTTGGGDQQQQQQHQNPDEDEDRFFSDMALQLFHNVAALFEQVDAQFNDRARQGSVGAQMTAFCVYCCGLFAACLVKYPRLCPNPAVARSGPDMLCRTMAILAECQNEWPLAPGWLRALERFVQHPSGLLAAVPPLLDCHDPVPVALPGARSLILEGSSHRAAEPAPTLSPLSASVKTAPPTSPIPTGSTAIHRPPSSTKGSPLSNSQLQPPSQHGNRHPHQSPPRAIHQEYDAPCQPSPVPNSHHDQRQHSPPCPGLPSHHPHSQHSPYPPASVTHQQHQQPPRPRTLLETNFHHPGMGATPPHGGGSNSSVAGASAISVPPP